MYSNVAYSLALPLPSRVGITYASSTNHSSSTTVRSLMKLLVVSTTSWNITHPVDGCLVNITELGWTFRIAPSRAERYVPSGCILAAFYFISCITAHMVGFTLKYPETRHFRNLTASPSHETIGIPNLSRYFFSCFRMDTARSKALWLIR
jgi:hypothetical protein